MITCYYFIYRCIYTRMMLCLLVVVALMLGVQIKASAQLNAHVGNRFINAFVVSSPSSSVGGGRFYMESGSDYGSTRFLYAITSCVVFRVKMGMDEQYYTNARPTVGEQPLDDRDNTPVPYLPFDSIYVASPDTVVVIWKKVGMHSVTMRMFTEKQRNAYDDGGDIVIEFSYTSDPFFPSELGIFMMLDTYNSGANSAGGRSDRASVMTNRGYFPADGPGRQFTLPYDTLPDFYHVGDFTYQAPPRLNEFLSIHRLKGYSHGGLPLTAPSMFAIGTWPALRYRSWYLDGTDLNRALGDCATVVRWEKLVGQGTVRTAFGLTDRKGNDVYHCRDNGVFIDIKTVRLIEQTQKDGPYNISQFDVEMWVSNTGLDANTYTIYLTEPIGAGELGGRLVRDASTPAVQSIYLMPRATAKLVWRLNVAPGFDDSLITVPLDFRYLVVNSGGTPRLLRDKCQPLITIKRWRETVTPPPPADTLPPPIERLSYDRDTRPTWTFRTFDRHRNYPDDTGLDRIEIERNDDGNIALEYQPSPFVRCDTTVNVTIKAWVVDTTRSARMVFRVRDCYGNTSYDSVRYTPRPDIFPPEIDSVVAVGGAAGVLCNAREYLYYLIDSLNQTPEAGDNGFGSIDVLPGLSNFKQIEINFDRSNIPIQPFDARATFRLQVIDSMVDASARVRVADLAGNADTIAINYCTLPDTLPPVAVVMPIPPADPGDPVQQWDVIASDVRAWDRGLESIVVLSNRNMNYTAPAITPGQDSVLFSVNVNDLELDGELVLEVRDRYYADNPRQHADTVRIVYLNIPDTMAPNIIFRPVPGANGAVVDVEVNDIHYINSDLYRFDRGLAGVRPIAVSPNMTFSEITFSPGARSMQFRVTVVDTLQLHRYDSICLEAVDLYNNRSEACYYYPLLPDIHSPIVTATMSPDRKTVIAQATDIRHYDRGLGGIRLDNGVNARLAGGMIGGLDGAPIYDFQLEIADPTRAISGVLVVSDLIALLDSSPAVQQQHTVRLPFDLPSVHLRVALPASVESGYPIRAAIVAASPFGGAEVHTLAFVATYGGAADFTGTEPGLASLNITAGPGKLDIALASVAGRQYGVGDTLGFLTFVAHKGDLVDQFLLSVDPATVIANNNQGTLLSDRKQGDAEASTLRLPAPYAAVIADSITYINGECERILDSRGGGHSKAGGFAVLAVMPQPATVASGMLRLDLRNLPSDGARGEFVAPDGRTLAFFTLRGSGEPLSRVSVALPSDLPAGAYFLRLKTEKELAWIKVMIVE